MSKRTLTLRKEDLLPDDLNRLIDLGFTIENKSDDKLEVQLPDGWSVVQSACIQNVVSDSSGQHVFNYVRGSFVCFYN